ncbi:uncharacterized protein [Nicotiana tomentosiformis]|uniref:uncharacterized protein n=1 Tax=Nicotiana tomentosiformis TaxID=4098 RepID=UPI00388CD734
MALVFRYVNKEGEVIERFIGIVYVSNTSSMSLKKAICSFLSDHSLSPTQIRGQGYDGASNMQGELNGIKTLIMNESPSAYCIYCFAHQLQLTLVALAKKHSDVDDFFCIVANVLNIVGASFKLRDLLREHQVEKLEELLKSGEVHTGRGLNQERGLQRPGDTHWGSHYKILDNLIVLFPSIIHVLEFTARECPNYADKIIVESLMDLHFQELNRRFDAVSTDLLQGMASLNPVNSFGNIDKNGLMRWAEYYPNEFDSSKLRDLSC